ncbi:MAG: c-type cytochrome [Saprospiraceae bacterium]|nr:c-type cytochrome [Saprospiraceae bacterium]
MHNLPNYLMVLLLAWGGLFVSSCNEQARGFALPDGDIEEGKAVYSMFSCNECHRISDIEWKGGSDDLNIPLGGEISTQKTYGDLVTSIINPSHKIARRYKQETSPERDVSKMKNYNEVLTVQELIDLVTFLQSEYKVKTPPTDYHLYHY